MVIKKRIIILIKKDLKKEGLVERGSEGTKLVLFKKKSRKKKFINFNCLLRYRIGKTEQKREIENEEIFLFKKCSKKTI